jgi:hypothetical protein
MGKPVYGRGIETTYRLRAIWLNPLRLYNHRNILSDLQIFVDGIQAQLNDVIDKGKTWHLIKSVEIVVILLKVAGTWSIYLTKRYTK